MILQSPLWRRGALAVALGLCLLAGQPLRAQHYSFKSYGPDEGLTTAVNKLLQDRDGFLWVGTSNGLFRYDGERFHRFGAAEGLPSVQISHMRQSADGTLWIVTSMGLARFHQNRFERVDSVPVKEPEGLSDLDFDGRGDLYLGTVKGLLIGEPAADGKLRFRFADPAPRVPIHGVHFEPGDGVWFGCGKSLCHLRPDGLEIFGASQGLPEDRWSAILRDRQGTLWVRGMQRLYVRPRGSPTFIARDAGLPESTNSALDLALDSAGTVLVSTDLGLARWVAGRWSLVGSAQGLASDTVSSVLEDREGSLWIGLWGAGLARWLGYGEWTEWTADDGLGNNVIWAIRRECSGAMLVGTDHGLARFDESRRHSAKLWRTEDGLGGNKVKALVVGKDGAIWIGSLPGGVSRLDPVTGRIRNFGPQSGLEDVNVIGLYIDRANRLWASTAGGLFRSGPLDGVVRFERQTPPSTSGHEVYFRLMGDHLGRVWVGSVAGAFCWDGGKWTRFTTADGLKSNGVSHLTEAPDGAIWIGYREPLGLSRMTFPGGKPHLNHYSRATGMASDYVLFLGVDAGGTLWVGTDDGIDLYKGSAWTQRYGRDDGLVWNDAAAGAFLAEDDGTVWVGTLKGLSRYRPSGRRVPKTDPRAVITGIKLGDASVDPGTSVEIPFRQHSLFVNFAGLTFRHERDVRFRYRLVGLEEGWTETSGREARYPSLPAGGYRFEVKVCSADGRWSATPARFSFRVLPPWWQTWWFRGAFFGLLLLTMYAVWQWRMRTLVRRHGELALAVSERTAELQCQKDLIERQKFEIEELLKRSQEISRLKSEFLANMSHEIRTPMNGVIGMTQLALSTELDDEQRDYLTTIRKSGDSLLGIINDILDFSKIEAGKLELANEPFGLRDCLTDAFAAVAFKAREKNLALSWTAAPEVPDRLSGDAGRLRQVVLNLAGNAIKFTERGEVSLRVEMENSEGAGCCLRFSVHDTGIGIAHGKEASIFEAFVQADGSTTRRYGGTGLGLAICAQLVGLMQGKIWVESELGRGSVFCFTARFGVAEPGAAQADAPETPGIAESTRSLRILLAEDNAVNQRVAQRMLQKMGHEVLVAGNGREAFEASQRERFDLVLMDVQMPEMDGFEATCAIRLFESQLRQAQEGRPPVPVVAMTAHAMSGDRDLCLAAGMDDYIAKPVDAGKLAGVIGKHCSRRT
jgi:signal transduction histidine kinase/ligand-binding sensor domain-containing protein/ActR/RegA family two-component response regulator